MATDVPLGKKLERPTAKRMYRWERRSKLSETKSDQNHIIPTLVLRTKDADKSECRQNDERLDQKLLFFI